ncbi:hypothetical protein Cni_G09885 [Canna indica]|uniref:3-hydroxyacyl-CoA dehydrogenase NAD binding domain-containing protein n=1 Tax=Canna indica TaxID=4628 RepID=A0AAQ3Q9D5_9LILI|nr:hypothetical protein Cni_G09885 [Canna indica]
MGSSDNQPFRWESYWFSSTDFKAILDMGLFTPLTAPSRPVSLLSHWIALWKQLCPIIKHGHFEKDKARKARRKELEANILSLSLLADEGRLTQVSPHFLGTTNVAETKQAAESTSPDVGGSPHPPRHGYETRGVLSVLRRVVYKIFPKGEQGIDSKFLQKGLKMIQANLEGLMKKESLTQDKMNKTLSLVKGALDYSEFKDVDMVIEPRHLSRFSVPQRPFLLQSPPAPIEFVVQYEEQRIFRPRQPPRLSLRHHSRWTPALRSRQEPKRPCALLCTLVKKTCSAPFTKLLTALNDPSSGVPPVAYVISDFICSFTLNATTAMAIPNIYFYSFNACGFMGIFYYKDLMERGIILLKSEEDLRNGYLDTIIDWIPGMPKLRLKDLTSFLRMANQEDLMLNFLGTKTIN